MKIVKTSNFDGFVRSDAIQYSRAVDFDLKNVILALTNRIRFGRGNDGDRGENIAGEFQQFTTNATANTEDTVAHTLGVTPVGRIIIWQDKAGVLYQGPSTGTAWDASNVYFKCNAASVTFLIFLLK